MKTKVKTTENSSDMVKLAVVGVGIAGLAAAAYFFLGPKGKKHQKDVKAWAIKMKGDVVEKLEQASEVSEAVYREIIDSVATEYIKGSKASNEEINDLAQDLKKHWQTIRGSVETAKKDVVKGATRIAEKAVRYPKNTI